MLYNLYYVKLGMFLQIFSLLGAIGLFLYGLNMLSNGLLKLSGDRLQKFLPWMKKNPVNSILSGFCITTIAESSSAATVMVVSFVNAGVLALSQAILVIMGANIGASFTTWIIALLGFLIDIKYVTYPLIAAGFILTMMKGPKRKVFGDVLLGFGLLSSAYPSSCPHSQVPANFRDSPTAFLSSRQTIFSAFQCLWPSDVFWHSECNQLAL